MSALISIVKNTRWIDLSDKHRQLREYLEEAVEGACINGKPDKIIMIKGAFGIGKTNTLHYLFHYGWCKLNIPVFFVSLEKLYPVLEIYAETFPNKKIGNVDLGKFLDQKINSVINSIKTGIANEDSKLFFFDWSDSDLISFTSGFNKLKLEKYIDNKFEKEEFAQLTPELINQVISTGHRPLLLIDEFETKFTKLKALIDASNGGELRELFDDVVEKRVSFNLIIGNGPSSGYELSNDKTNKGSDDAESSRIIPKQVPFPLPETTKDFLGTSNKGLLNFAWWASRCRARHFLRLKESVGSLDQLISKNSYAEFLSDFTFFSDPIESSEEGSSPITYVKTGFFNEFPEELKDIFLPKLITEISPLPISFEKYRASITKSKKYLFCSPAKINVSEKLMTALSLDINEGMIKSLKDKGMFLELDYDLTLRKYFDFFLKSISDTNGEIAFGMVDDLAADQSFCELFLLPLIHLCYDFITQYEEESVSRNSQATEFLLNLLSDIKIKSDQKNVRAIFPNTYPLFKKNDYLDGEGYIQLSLGAIRETFEQPIGEPKLNYKNLNIATVINKLVIDKNIPVFKHSVDDVELYFIPDLPIPLLKGYIDNLKQVINDGLLKKSHENGKLAINFIYFSDNVLIEDFKNSILYLNNDKTLLNPSYSLGKFDIKKITAYNLNFPNHTFDFLDSIIKIGLIGFQNGDLGFLSTSTKERYFEISSIVNAIKHPDWTERKETRRTIEHFEKLVLKNEKSELNSIAEQIQEIYELQLESVFPEKKNISRLVNRYILNDDLHRDSTYGSFTKKIINLFLLENKLISEGFFNLMKNANDFKLGAKTSERDTKLSFWEFKDFIKKNEPKLKEHFNTFSNEDSTIQSLTKLNDILLQQPMPDELNNFTQYLSYTQDHFIGSYHKKLGDYSALSLTETIYNHCFASNIDLDKTKTSLIQEIQKFNDSIITIRSNIAIINDNLKELLKLDEVPFAYEAKLGEVALKLANQAKKLIENDVTISLCLVISELVGYFDSILKDAQQFLGQINQLNSAIQSKANIISALQVSVNSIYSDTFTANILNNVKGITKQDGDYYWSTRILPTIKAIPKYSTIFKNKDLYLPNGNRTIDKDDIQVFINDLNNKFTEKKLIIDSDKKELDINIVEIKKMLNLELELIKLLTVETINK